MATVIVFGPTGHVGSAVAQTAHAYGASKVILAMRDPSKPIPGLTPAMEAARAFQRVRADLSDLASVAAAVTTTGATRAFLYLQHGSPDHMRGVLDALHTRGIQFVVFLSSLTLPRGTDLAAVSVQPDPIAWAHAQVELNLGAVFGAKGFAAVRPAFFATNAFTWWGDALATGEIGMVAPDLAVDWITPDDIGKVCAAILGAGTVKDGDDEAVCLVGPQNVPLRDGAVAIARAAFPENGELVVKRVTADEQVEALEARGMPPHIARHVAESLAKLQETQKDGLDWMPEGNAWETAVAAAERYTGEPPMTLPQWIEKYKGQFRP
jgi:nucleoside-diphosphate-sugar epimerase